MIGAQDRRDQSRQLVPQPPARSPAERSRQLVLLVEDDPNDLRMYGTALWYNGFDVVTAEDGEAAVALAREYEPDLVLLDLLLPKLTGLEVCQQIRGMGSRVPVVALTGRRRREFGDRAREVGCTDYIEKPVGPLDVLHFVEKVVGRPPAPGDDSGDSPRRGQRSAGEGRREG